MNFQENGTPGERRPGIDMAAGLRTDVDVASREVGRVRAQNYLHEWTTERRVRVSVSLVVAAVLLLGAVVAYAYQKIGSLEQKHDQEQAARTVLEQQLGDLKGRFTERALHEGDARASAQLARSSAELARECAGEAKESASAAGQSADAALLGARAADVSAEVARKLVAAAQLLRNQAKQHEEAAGKEAASAALSAWEAIGASNPAPTPVRRGDHPLASSVVNPVKPPPGANDSTKPPYASSRP